MALQRCEASAVGWQTRCSEEGILPVYTALSAWFISTAAALHLFLRRAGERTSIHKTNPHAAGKCKLIQNQHHGAEICSHHLAHFEKPSPDFVQVLEQTACFGPLALDIH